VVISKKLFQRAKKDKNAKVREKAVLDKIEKVHEKNETDLLEVLISKLQVLLKDHINRCQQQLRRSIGKGAKFTQKNLSGIDYLNVNPGMDR
jgi:DNA-directed RNA polymerase subunit beta